jgi:pyruvate/2-oxoglutarate/acetoin dehydrogenase E1 component
MTTTDAATVDMMLGAALNQALGEALERDPSVVIIGEDIADPSGGVMKVTAGLSTKFGTSRVRDTPISEIAIGGVAVGSAVAGLRPVVEIMLMDFLSIALDQLQNHGAQLHYITNGTLRVPLTVRVMCGAGTGVGATHSQSLETWLMHSPGFKVATPSSAADAKGLLTTCIFDDDPCIFIENALGYGLSGPVPQGTHQLPVGVANVLREGTDITLIGYGATVAACTAAAEQLAGEGISAEVIDLRWLAPLDMTTVLTSVAKTRRAVVTHNARRLLGPGAEIAATIHEELFGDLLSPVARVASPWIPVPASPALEQAYYPNMATIADAARSCCDTK